jgi:hypothetical protein
MRLPRISRVFSVPFGKEHHINAAGLKIVRELGFRAVLLNTGGVNPVLAAAKSGGIEIVDRFSPVNADIAWPLRRAFLKSMVRREVRAGAS